MKLPYDLPQKILFDCPKIKGLQARLDYTLTAELTSSKVPAYEHELLVYRPLNKVKIPLPFKIDHMVGGLFNLNQTRSATEFSLDAQYFNPGDQIHVIVNSNNQLCTTAIKSFKFKLFRRSTFVVDGIA